MQGSPDVLYCSNPGPSATNISPSKISTPEGLGAVSRALCKFVLQVCMFFQPVKPTAKTGMVSGVGIPVLATSPISLLKEEIALAFSTTSCHCWSRLDLTSMTQQTLSAKYRRAALPCRSEKLTVFVYSITISTCPANSPVNISYLTSPHAKRGRNDVT